MKAVICEKYGGVDVLDIKEIDKPSISDEQILVKVYATSVNPIDYKIRQGQLKILTGSKPPQILGVDYAGVIEQIGMNVSEKKYKNGDHVYGIVNALSKKSGAYAEYVAVTPDSISLMPKDIDFITAAALPLVSLTALQSMLSTAKLQKGDNIYINGCTTGVGIAAVQIAKSMNCRITGVCSTKSVTFARKSGVDVIIDYKKDDIFDSQEKYDVFLDVVGTSQLSRIKNLLTSNGRYVAITPTPQMYLQLVYNLFRKQKFYPFLLKSNAKDLSTLTKMVEKGIVSPVINKTFNLADIRKAHLLAQEKKMGKVVLRVEHKDIS